MDLLQQFLREECSPEFCEFLLKEIAALESSPRSSCREFNFNRFDLKVDVANGVALLEDDLDPSDEGRYAVQLADFVSALRQCAAGG